MSLQANPGDDVEHGLPVEPARGDFLRNVWSRALEFFDRLRSRLPLRWRESPGQSRFTLNTLRPQFRRDHEPYARYLIAALRQRGETAPRNIALSAGYGMGKSSVFQGVARAFKGRVVEITFGTLHHDAKTESDNASVVRHGLEVRTIQQEVVKQLLYSAKPSRVPRSRFRRLDRFRFGWAAAIVVPTATTVVVLMYNSNLAVRLEGLAAEAAWPVWTVYAILWLALIVGSLLVLGSIGAVVRLGKVSAGSTSIELTDVNAGGDYFDRYLDEIVYFFQKTRRDIVLFEDIDRFGNPEAFEELRELNAILNRAEQLSRRPVRFLYSVRDSLFDEWPADAESELPDGLRRAALRTKFFDLVVPMIPTITHRTARDVMAKLRESFGGEELAEDLVQEVARSVPDMRVLLGMLNELKVFRAVTAGPNGPELDAETSFAVVVYKTLEPADFELLQFNKSKLDQLFDHARALVVARSELIRGELAAWTLQEEVAATEERLATAAAGRVTRRLGRYLKFGRVTGTIAWSIDGVAQAEGAITTPAFWRSLLANTGAVVGVSGASSARSWEIPATELLDIANVSTTTWGAGSLEQAKQRHQAMLDEQRTLPRASWQELYTRTDIGAGQERFADKVRALFPDSVVPRLIEMGYLNEDFHLYASLFHGRYLGRRAATFVHRYVHRRETSYEFVIGDQQEVTAMLNDLGDSFLSEESALNINIVDVLLESGRPGVFFERYVDPNSAAREFAGLYLRTGGHPVSFVREVAPIWSEVFEFLIATDQSSREDLVALVSAAIVGAEPTRSYSVPDELLDPLTNEVLNLPLLTETTTPEVAQRIAAVIAGLTIEVADLSSLSDALRAAVVTSGHFSMTYSNLRIAGSGSVSLDALLVHEPLFSRVVARLESYADLLDEHDAISVESPERFEEVVGRLGDSDARAAERVFRRAAPGSAIEALDEVPKHTWDPLVRSRRATPTLGSISTYLAQTGPDQTLIEYLADTDAIDAAEALEVDRVAHAKEILGIAGLAASDKARLVKSLSLSAPLPVADIPIDSPTIPGALLAGKIVSDDTATFEWARAAGAPALRSYLGATENFEAIAATATLSASELERVFDPKEEMPEHARAAVHEFVNRFESEFTLIVWRHYGHWLVTRREVLKAARLTSLFRQRIWLPDALDLLLLAGSSLSSDELEQVVVAIGGVYRKLVEVARGSETLEQSDRHIKLAELLDERHLIASWRQTLTGKVQVYRRQK